MTLLMSPPFLYDCGAASQLSPRLTSSLSLLHVHHSISWQSQKSGSTLETLQLQLPCPQASLSLILSAHLGGDGEAGLLISRCPLAPTLLCLLQVISPALTLVFTHMINTSLKPGKLLTALQQTLLTGLLTTPTHDPSQIENYSAASLLTSLVKTCAVLSHVSSASKRIST